MQERTQPLHRSKHMSNSNESPNDDINPWTYLKHKLHTTRFDHLPTDEEVDALMATLPKRYIGESLSQWLERTRLARKDNLFLTSDKFKPIATFERRAASSGTEEFPLPAMPLKTKDFHLTITKIGDEIKIQVEALKHAQSSYSRKNLQLYDNLEDELLIADINTDNNGNGFAVRPDTPDVRKALWSPVLVER